MANLCADTNAVLKLQLGEKGETRRILLRKLWDEATNTVSYQRLVELALEYKNKGDIQLAPSEYIVTITYIDEDGDEIMISSDDELADAFDQFAKKTPSVVRANALVKRVLPENQSTENKKAFLNKLSNAVSEIKETAETKSSKDHKDNDIDRNGTDKTQQIQNIIDTFVSLIITAVETLTKNIETVNERTASPTCSPQKSVCPSFSSQLEERATALGDKIERKKEVAGDSMKETIEKTKKENEEKEKMKNTDPNDIEVSDCFDRNFIHGRHTCDGCFVTPIIGIRYHATNMPDYDLCEKCIGNYKGNNVVFEPAQLDRDRHLQMRWKRRQARLNRMADISIGEWTANHHGCRRGRQAARDTDDMDDNLKEAIRRSLQDANQQRVQGIDCERVNITQDPKKSEEEITVAPQDVEKTTPVRVKEEPKDKDANQSDKASFQSLEKAVTSVIESSTKDDNATEASVKEDVTVTFEDVSEKDCDDKSKATDAEYGNSELLSTEKGETKSIDSVDTSFAKDAEGSGDVAIAIGSTLDNCAEAINAIVSEFEKSAKTSNTDSLDGELEIVDSSEPDDVISREGSSVKTAEDTGETILEGVDSPKGEEDNEGSVKSEASSEGWQVLDENGQITHDEMIAQAAQLLGSALFQSDMGSKPISETKIDGSQTSVSVLSAGSNDGSRSFAASVPSVVPSISNKSAISSVLLSRWDDELRQLHELGFYDDHRSVDALEHLEAANMGVDSEDAVTVTSVVNYLLSKD